MWDHFDDVLRPRAAPVSPSALAALRRAGRPSRLGPADRGAIPTACREQPARGAADRPAFWGRDADVVHPPVDLARFDAARPGRARRAATSSGSGPSPPTSGWTSRSRRSGERDSRCGSPATGRTRGCSATGSRPTCAGWGRCPTPTSRRCTAARGRWSSPARRTSASPRWRRTPPAARSSPSRAAARWRPSPPRRACSSTRRRRRRWSRPSDGSRPSSATSLRRGPGRARSCSRRSGSAMPFARKVEAVIAGRPDLRDRLPW